MENVDRFLILLLSFVPLPSLFMGIIIIIILSRFFVFGST